EKLSDENRTVTWRSPWRSQSMRPLRVSSGMPGSGKMRGKSSAALREARDTLPFTSVASIVPDSPENPGTSPRACMPRSAKRPRAAMCPGAARSPLHSRSEEHTSELQSPCNLVCRLLLEKKNLLFERNFIDFFAPLSHLITSHFL